MIPYSCKSSSPDAQNSHPVVLGPEPHNVSSPEQWFAWAVQPRWHSNEPCS